LGSVHSLPPLEHEQGGIDPKVTVFQEVLVI
jgi:hypothetical protein